LGTNAGPVDTLATLRAVIRAKLGLATHAGPPTVADANTVRRALAVTIAVVGTVWTLAPKASPSALTLAKTVGFSIASSVVGALHGAPLDIALLASVHSLLADTHAV